MDDDAQLERDLALARRLKVAVRLVVYPALVGALFLALHIRHAQAAGDDEGTGFPVRGDAVAPATWTGVSSGYALAAWTVGTTVTGVRATFPLACRDGTSFTLRFDDLDLANDAAGSWNARTSEHTRADDGGALTVDQHVRAERIANSVSLSWQASVLWTRHDTGRVVLCEGGPVNGIFLRMSEPGSGGA
jgi:hypothetical protein